MAVPVTMTPSDRKNSAAWAVSAILTSEVRACALKQQSIHSPYVKFKDVLVIIRLKSIIIPVLFLDVCKDLNVLCSDVSTVAQQLTSASI